MAENHVLPEELREIFRIIGIDLAKGPESESGSFFLLHIESAMKQGGISSETFGINYPNLSNHLKAIIAIELLYQLIKSELLVKIEAPRYKRGADGSLQEITVLEHLENLVKLFQLSKT